jgi:hypothetical protein
MLLRRVLASRGCSMDGIMARVFANAVCHLLTDFICTGYIDVL